MLLEPGPFADGGGSLAWSRAVQTAQLARPHRAFGTDSGLARLRTGLGRGPDPALTSITRPRPERSPAPDRDSPDGNRPRARGKRVPGEGRACLRLLAARARPWRQQPAPGKTSASPSSQSQPRSGYVVES